MDLLEGVSDASDTNDSEVEEYESQTQTQSQTQSESHTNDSSIENYSKYMKLLDPTQDDLALAKAIAKAVPLLEEELETVHRSIVETCKEWFPGVEDVLLPEQYVRWVAFHLQSRFKGDLPDQLEPQLSPEQQLIISTLSHRFTKVSDLGPSLVPLGPDLKPEGKPEVPLVSLLHHYLKLHKLQSQAQERLIAVIEQHAPNVCALVGPQLAAQLVGHYGSVRELSLVPSCNLVTLGRGRTHASGNSSGNSSGIATGNARGKGLIYSCDIVQMQLPAFQKQAARMVCAKLVLAARVDAPGQSLGQSQGISIGSTMRSQLLEKLQKIATPPQLARTKPLPVPQDAPKKKRAGKRFRKYKQQFQLSQMRQLQNRMEFGTAEHTTMDAYGEEIGMGLVKGQVSGQVSGPSQGPGQGPSPKLSKAMRKRLDTETSGHDPGNSSLMDDPSLF